MYVRKIKDNEVKRADELFYISFEIQDHCEQENQSGVKAQSRGEYFANQKWAAFDENESMMGVISVIPYDIQFDGKLCAMTGIGGVCCLPQHRRKGVVKSCFLASLKDMYEKDFTFSYLYPFSTSYYRKFGYELCSQQANYTISTRAFKRFDVGGEAHLVEHGAYLDDIKKVYDDFKQGYNLMAAREAFDYSWAVNADPAKDGHYIYVYKNEEGEAKGVLSFEKVKSEKSYEMRCDRFFFSDTEGLKGLLNHVLMFEAYYESVSFSLPANINLIPYIPEWALYHCSCRLLFNGMVRAVNVQKVLEAAKYRGSGNLTIKVRDAIIEQNNHSFEVLFEKGSAVRVALSENTPDIELDIADFSACMVGAYHPEEIALLESVAIHTTTEAIGSVFYKKPNFIADFF